jgi:histidinol-phosphatase (PHP family)
MSDDSHGVDQVGYGYRQVLEFIDRTGITTLHYLDVSEGEDVPDSRFPETTIRSVSVQKIKQAPFWL